MKLSVSCPNCGKQFRNIKPEMAGKKARCSCGMVVRLGPKRSHTTDTTSGKPKPHRQPGNRLPVELRGDEILGDQLLGGDLSETRPPEVPRTSDQSQASPDVVEVPVVIVPPLGLAHPKPAKIKRQAPKPKSHGPEPHDRKPVFNETYNDVDEILTGLGDAAPLVVRPQPAPPEAAQTSPANTEHSKQPRPSTISFVAAIGSAILAFWFGVLIVWSRFQLVDLPLLREFSQTLESVYLAVFGTADVSLTFQRIFISLGWALWVVAVALVLFAVAQFINAFVRILFGRSLLDWSDGLAAAAAVCIVFLMVALVFSHASFTKQQHRLLDEYDQPTVFDRGPVGNVELLRAEIIEQGNAFRTTMLFGAGVAMFVFMLAIFRLFFKTPHLTHGYAMKMARATKIA